MKVVLFCGGKGMRIRDYSENTPKPMVTIGYRPILWHLMKYYAYYGYKDFILCLGYKADVIKNTFRTILPYQRGGKSYNCTITTYTIGASHLLIPA